MQFQVVSGWSSTDHLFTMLSFNIKDLKNFFNFQDSPNISFVSDELLITAYKFNIISDYPDSLREVTYCLC